jgi:hypothetical protein
VLLVLVVVVVVTTRKASATAFSWSPQGDAKARTIFVPNNIHLLNNEIV